MRATTSVVQLMQGCWESWCRQVGLWFISLFVITCFCEETKSNQSRIDTCVHACTKNARATTHPHTRTHAHICVITQQDVKIACLQRTCKKYVHVIHCLFTYTTSLVRGHAALRITSYSKHNQNIVYRGMCVQT